MKSFEIYQCNNGWVVYLNGNSGSRNAYVFVTIKEVSDFVQKVGGVTD